MSAGSWTPPVISMADGLRLAEAEDHACRTVQPPAAEGHCDCELHHRDTRWTGWELCTAAVPGYLVYDDYADQPEQSQREDWYIYDSGRVHLVPEGLAGKRKGQGACATPAPSAQHESVTRPATPCGWSSRPAPATRTSSGWSRSAG